MLDSFLNPWSMAAGALLMSVPLIIHLINRMRFKRIQWAAMEFLLKAQKRMRRKMILQQLLLLLLRMLMVLLLGMLVGRFLGCNPLEGKETRATSHVVILDDSPSMGDGWRDEISGPTDAFAVAKKVLVDQIGPAAAQASTPQLLDIVRLSEPAAPRSFGRLNTSTLDEARNYLGGYKPSTVRGDMVAALKKANEIAAQGGQDVARVIHVLSDMRSTDWEQDGPALRQQIDLLTKAGTKVHFVDVAHPYRKPEKRPPLFHDNIGIVELRPAKLVVAQGEQVEWTLRVKNFGVAEWKDVRCAVAVNGDDNKGQSVVIPTLPAGQEKSAKFYLTFNQIGSPEKPLDRFSLVTARLELTDKEKDSIAADDARHAVVEVRAKLPILVIDGKPGDKDKKEGDSFYLQKVFTSVVGGFTWVPGAVRDLEQADLRQYSCILILNVPALTEPAAKKLDEYVLDGGGVGFFLGNQVKPAEYNKFLYADGNGPFPVPLPDKPSEALADDKVLEKLFSFTKKILLRDKPAKAHPALYSIYHDDRGQEGKDDDLEKFFNFVIVRQYWPIKRIGKWRDDPRVKELYCLPNDAPMSQYEPAAKEFADKLPVEQPKFAKFKEVLTAARAELRKTYSSTEPLYKLATVLDRVLVDQRSDGDPSEALLREFWGLPEMVDLKLEALRLRDATKFGDPLYIARSHGRGRVTLLTTTGGEAWNDWPSGPGRPSWVPIMSELERYLSGGGTDETRAVGSPLVLSLPAAQYKPNVGRAFVTVDPFKETPDKQVKPLEFTDLKDQVMTADAGNLVLNFPETAKPGAYLFSLTRLKGQAAGGEAAEVPEYQAFAYNVDVAREGDLRRPAGDDVMQNAPGALLHSAGDPGWIDDLKNKKTDLTEAGWLFLALLIVLILEHWMAVKLSFHTAGQAETAPSAAAYRRPAAPVV